MEKRWFWWWVSRQTSSTIERPKWECSNPQKCRKRFCSGGPQLLYYSSFPFTALWILFCENPSLRIGLWWIWQIECWLIKCWTSLSAFCQKCGHPDHILGELFGWLLIISMWSVVLRSALPFPFCLFWNLPVSRKLVARDKKLFLIHFCEAPTKKNWEPRILQGDALLFMSLGWRGKWISISNSLFCISCVLKAQLGGLQSSPHSNKLEIRYLFCFQQPPKWATRKNRGFQLATEKFSTKFPRWNLSLTFWGSLQLVSPFAPNDYPQPVSNEYQSTKSCGPNRGSLDQVFIGGGVTPTVWKTWGNGLPKFSMTKDQNTETEQNLRRGQVKKENVSV